MLDSELITIDLGDLWVPSYSDLGMKNDGTFLEASPEREFMKEHFKKGDVFWDVGAHVGFFSLFAHSLGARHIEAFEVHPKNYDLLRENFRIHDIPGNTWHVALGDEASMTSVWHSINNSGDHMVGNGGPTHTFLSKVKMTPLDFVSAKPPDFIKIDVQGSEAKVLRGAKGVIETHKPVMMIEYSPWHLECQGVKPHDFLDNLYRLPYDIECSYGDAYSLPSPEYTTLYLEPIC